MLTKLEIKGVWGAAYELPSDPLGIQSNVCVTKKDGKKFYLPVADVRAIAQTIEAQVTLIEVMNLHETQEVE